MTPMWSKPRRGSGCTAPTGTAKPNVSGDDGRPLREAHVEGRPDPRQQLDHLPAVPPTRGRSPAQVLRLLPGKELGYPAGRTQPALPGHARGKRIRQDQHCPNGTRVPFWSRRIYDEVGPITNQIRPMGPVSASSRPTGREASLSAGKSDPADSVKVELFREVAGCVTNWVTNGRKR